MLFFQLFLVVLYILLSPYLVASGPTSPNDPFRAIALLKPRQPAPPICCLKPLAPIELVEDETLLSFEEWKAKQSELQAQAKSKALEMDVMNRLPPGTANDGASIGDNGVESTIVSTDKSSSKSGNTSAQEEVMPGQYIEPVSPHFRVPLTDRFNYASLDCSARVHTAHRSAKSASSILSSKRDRYMLSPCNNSNKEKQFVIVELCDDIRIDTVQLANFEFFSGVFKEFSVSVAKTYTMDLEGWTHAGTYKAKNVRGVQSFHPPTSLRDFYRYIRIDFLSHYGSEYYCPVSLLRVYGLTHLEHWKWDIWETESKTKQEELEKAKHPPLPLEHPSSKNMAPPVSVTNPSADILSSPTESSNEANKPIPEIAKQTASDEFSTMSASTPSQTTLNQEHEPATLSDSETPFPKPLPSASNDIQDTQDTTNGKHDLPSGLDQHLVHSTDTYVSSSTGTTLSSGSNSVRHSSSSPILENLASPSSLKSAMSSASETVSQSDAYISSTRRPTPSPFSSLSYNPPAASPSLIVAPVPPPAPTGGESIYRTIMNRLSALETNHTLYTRYIEQQNGAIREVIKRLGEDIGRLEGITRAQGLTYQRTVNEWERQRHQMMVDYGQLMSRVEHLSEEVVLEKRLGVAQLCLLLAVLVFMGLTRGSRGESIIVSAPVLLNDSVKAWGKRHLSLSGDWTSRLMKKSLSPERPKPQSPNSFGPPSATHLEDRVKFPKKESWKKKAPLEPIQLNTAVPFNELPSRVETMSLHSRPRTPSLRTSAARRVPPSLNLQRPVTPTPTRTSYIRPQAIQRSSSHANAGSWSVHGPKSAKRWARTAHLHEVKTAGHAHPQTHANTASQNLGARHSHPQHRKENYGTFPWSESDRENEDVFSAPAGSVNFPPLRRMQKSQASSPEISDKHPVKDKGEGKGKGMIDGETSMVKSEEGEGDLWIDTDSVDGSDVD